MAIHELCEISELPPGECRAFKIDGVGVALYNVDGEFHATQDFCRHKGGSLGKGELDGSIVICPLHGWRFNVITGDCLTQPHCRKLRRFPVVVQNGTVSVEME